MRFKKEGKRNKKVLFYGLDGSGKTYSAVKYCETNGLKPVLIDIEDTCFEDVPIVEIDDKNPRLLTKGICDAIKEVGESNEYDTIILDGISTLLEDLVSNAPGMKAYKDRSDSFAQILRTIRQNDVNIIFIGQADMKVIVSEEYSSNKPIIKLNAMVNEKYRCENKDGKFEVITEKMRK